MSSKMHTVNLGLCPEYKTSKRLICDKEEYKLLTNWEDGWLCWLRLKIYQYNVTIGLYMLDWWEKACFNLFIGYILFCICRHSICVIFEFLQILKTFTDLA